MHPLRKQRLQLVILIVVATTLVVGLVLYMLRENGNFFYTPTQIISGEAPQNVYLRAGGMVVDGSLQRADEVVETAGREYAATLLSVSRRGAGR